jgi:hypothetical protein
VTGCTLGHGGARATTDLTPPVGGRPSRVTSAQVEFTGGGDRRPSPLGSRWSLPVHAGRDRHAGLERRARHRAIQRGEQSLPVGGSGRDVVRQPAGEQVRRVQVAREPVRGPLDPCALDAGCFQLKRQSVSGGASASSATVAPSAPTRQPVHGLRPTRAATAPAESRTIHGVVGVRNHSQAAMTERATPASHHGSGERFTRVLYAG